MGNLLDKNLIKRQVIKFQTIDSTRVHYLKNMTNSVDVIIRLILQQISTIPFCFKAGIRMLCDLNRPALTMLPAVWCIVIIGFGCFVFFPSQAMANDACNPEPEIRSRLMMQIYGLRPNEFKPLPGCPGADDFEPGIGNFTLNDIDFRIPRKALWPMPDQADGPTASFAIKLRWPKLEIGTPSDPVENQISMFIKRISKSRVCSDGSCSSLRKYYYESFGLGKSFPKTKFLSKLASTISYEEKTQKSYFRNHSGHIVYFSGNIENPVNWYRCKGNEYCTSFLTSHQKIVVEFSLFGRSRMNDLIVDPQRLISILSLISNNTLKLELGK